MARPTPPRLSFYNGDGNTTSDTSPQSDYSPVNSTFSSNGHTRLSSSISSFSSSPEQRSSSVLNKRSAPLEDVAEDPFERPAPMEQMRGSYSFDLDNNWNAPPQSARFSFEVPARTSYDYRDEFFRTGPTPPYPQVKRHNSAFNRLTSRVFRLPTRSTRASRGLRVNTTQSAPCSAPGSEVTSPVSGRSRSNSRARPLFCRSGSDLEENVDAAKVSTSIDTIAEGVEVVHEARLSTHDEVEEPIARVSTPLLPLIMDEAMANPRIEDSILPAPNVASSSFVPTPHGTPQISPHDSPALSSRPSWAHFGHSQNDSMSPETPFIFPSEPNDEWSDKLGHADFLIEPTPYRPAYCSQHACQVLLNEWEKARAEYSKHLCRTSTHYGNTSRTYRLTEAKWTSIDAVWRENYTWAQARAREIGELISPDSPSEPAPVVKVPSMDDKFPQIGDAGIVGPLEVVPPPVQRQPSIKAQLFRIFGGLRGRSSSAL